MQWLRYLIIHQRNSFGLKNLIKNIARISFVYFLHSYCNASHVEMRKSPFMLFFNRPLKTYLPSCIDDTPLLDDIARKIKSIDTLKNIREKNLKRSTTNIAYW